MVPPTLHATGPAEVEVAEVLRLRERPASSAIAAILALRGAAGEHAARSPSASPPQVALFLSLSDAPVSANKLLHQKHEHQHTEATLVSSGRSQEHFGKMVRCIGRVFFKRCCCLLYVCSKGQPVPTTGASHYDDDGDKKDHWALQHKRLND